MRKITIIGFGTSAQQHPDLAAACEGREIWTMNHYWATKKFYSLKYDRIFALHTVDAINETYTDEMKHDPWTMLDFAGCPVFMRYPDTSRVRAAVEYPFRQVFQYHETNYCLGSPSYMMALALYEGVRDIETWGIDMLDDQHRYQLQSWIWWCKRVHELGAKIGGSGLAWMFQPGQEQDKGLVGLREWIGDELAQTEPKENTKED